MNCLFKKKCGLLAFYLALSSSAFCSDLELKLVTFFAPKKSIGWVTITPDDELHGPIKNFFVHAWNKNKPGEAKPVAYVSGYKAIIGAQLDSKGASNCPLKQIYVKAESPDKKFTLPPKPLSATFEYPKTEVNEEFKKYQVRAFLEFKLDWYYTTTPDDNNSWKLVGTSNNELFVVHKKTISDMLPGDDENTTFYHSSIYISCQAANEKGYSASTNKANPDEVVSSIFDEFRGLCVKKYKGSACMKYWGGVNPLVNNPVCRSIYGLYHFQDANCGEWSSLYQDLLKTHGISTGRRLTVTYQDQIGNIGFLNSATKEKMMDDIKVFFGEADMPNCGFLQNDKGQIVSYFFVKNYDFNLNPIVPPFYLYGVVKPDPFVISTRFTGNTISAADENGLPSQGISNPRSAFENHSMIQYKKQNGQKVYLDPSYGTPSYGFFESTNAYESAAMAGMGCVFDYLSPIGEVSIIWLNEFNTTNLQLNFK